MAWGGLGAWNYYFLGKLALALSGHLNFHLLLNLAFAALLLLPLPALLRGATLRWAERLRTLIAIPLGIALLIKDTWFPPIARLLEQRDALQAFSFDYLLTLSGRFINWDLLGSLFVAGVLLWFLSQWLRLTTFTLAGLSWMVIAPLWPQVQTQAQQPAASATTVTAPAQPPTQAAPLLDPATLDQQVAHFFEQQAAQKTRFQPPPEGAPPFDILMLQICSLSWDDLTMAGLQDHPLFKRMDVLFDQFNTATAYSGPASIRTLRASCGQPPNTQLYQNTDEDCYLFKNLAHLGFDVQLQLNNLDDFDGYLDALLAQGLPNMTIPESRFTAAPTMSTFDGKPLWNDAHVLQQWWALRLQQDQPRVALFYDSISLHDGNRYRLAGGGSRNADYRSRAQTLLDNLESFFDTLERSGRRTLVVLVPEHGYNLRGDRMQITGMRDIPSPATTHVPAGIKLIGWGHAQNDAPRHITQPSSYLAISELIARLAAQRSLETGQEFQWQPLLADLPTLPLWVAENGSVMVVQQGQEAYIRLNPQSAWQAYPR